MLRRLALRAGGLAVLLVGVVAAATTRPTPAGPPHEERDVNVGAVALAGVGLVLLLAVGLGVTTWMLVARTGAWPTLTPPPAGVAAGPDPAVLGPSGPGDGGAALPRLQPAPETDITRLRARERAALSRWGWVDREAGIAQIPIELAMELVAARGLPAFDGAAAPQGGAGGERSAPPAERPR